MTIQVARLQILMHNQINALQLKLSLLWFCCYQQYHGTLAWPPTSISSQKSYFKVFG